MGSKNSTGQDCKLLRPNRTCLWNIYIPKSDSIPNYPELLIARTENKTAKKLARKELKINPTQVKLATQALGIVMADLDILYRADGKTRLINFPKDQLDEQQITVY